MITSVTEVAPNDGTTFEVNVSAAGTGSIVLSIPPVGPQVYSQIYDSPRGAVLDSMGNLYTANYNTATVSKISPS